MDGASIAQVAEQTGFPASTLRYYDRVGLVRPDRTPAGYRTYGEGHLATLEFIKRAKGLGLSIEEITDLVSLLGAERCAPVQARLVDLLDARIAHTQEQIAELVAFAGQLQRARAGLGRHTPSGPCDDRCGCTTDPAVTDAAVRVPLVTRATPTAEQPTIACTLAPEQVGTRMGDWQGLIDQATSREATEGGTRLRFPPATDPAAITRLARAEQACCSFFAFTITIDTAGTTLDITAPPEARPVIDALVGAPA